MRNTQPPSDDVEQLKSDVLSWPPEAALPANLSDAWLYRIAADLRSFEEGSGERAEGSRLIAPVLIVTRLLWAKSGNAKASVSSEQMYEYLSALGVEVGIELMNRSSSAKATSATLETIFTNRKVRYLPANDKRRSE